MVTGKEGISSTANTVRKDDTWALRAEHHMHEDEVLAKHAGIRLSSHGRSRVNLNEEDLEEARRRQSRMKKHDHLAQPDRKSLGKNEGQFAPVFSSEDGSEPGSKSVATLAKPAKRKEDNSGTKSRDPTSSRHHATDKRRQKRDRDGRNGGVAGRQY